MCSLAPRRVPEILPRWLHGRRGASVVRRDAAVNRMEDLNVNGCEKIISCLETFCYFRKALAVGS